MDSMNTEFKKSLGNAVHVTDIHSPFIRDKGTQVALPYTGQTLAQMKETVVKRRLEVAASINGIVIPKEEWGTTVPKKGDCVIFIPIIAGDGGGKSWLMIFAFIAVIVVAPYITASLLPGVASTSATFMFLNATIMVTGGLLISSLMSPTAPKTDAATNINASQTYGWSPATKQQQGTSIPRFYGKNKLYGNIITAYTSNDAEDATKQYMNMAIALSRGPVKGITQTDGNAYDITLNDQPVQYFEDVYVDIVLGTNQQAALAPNSIPLNPTPEYRPNRKVTHALGAVSYLIPDSDFTALEIELAFPMGVYDISSGSAANHTVEFSIEIREALGAWHTLVNSSYTNKVTQPLYIAFKSTEAYEGGSALTIVRGTKYEVRVTKVSDDAGEYHGDELRLNSVRETLGTAFICPLTAMVGINALATEQLSGALSFSCILEGAVVDVYNGTTWSVEYSTNPAWVLWDILTDPIITGESEGNYVISAYRGIDPLLNAATPRMDLESFWELAQFCDGLVPDGAGGEEKNITFNGGFDVELTRWEAALKVCEIARCALVWNGATLSIVIDKATTPSRLFTVSNILKDSFKEVFMAMADRASEIEVQYRDQDQDYERVPFTVFDADAGNASNKVSLELFGTTKRSEAWRAAKYRLLQNKCLRRTLEFDVSIDALGTSVGRVVWVQHDVPQWGQAGRVRAATSTRLWTEQLVEIPLDETWEVLVRTYDPTTQEETYQERTLTAAGEGDGGYYIDVSTAFDPVPSVDDLYTLGKEDLYAQLVRITKISKKSDQIVTVSAIEYNAEVYSADSSIEIPDIHYTPPGSSGHSPISTPTWREVNNRFDNISFPIPEAMEFDLPFTSGVAFVADTPDPEDVAWEAAVFGEPLKVIYHGEPYEITASHSAFKFICWDVTTPTVFVAVNTLVETLGPGRWIVCYNDGGVPRPALSGAPITAIQIAPETITAVEIADSTITATQIADHVITAAQIAALTITAAEVASHILTAEQIAALTITAAEIANNTITAGQIAAHTITAAEIKALTITAAEIAANTITAAKIVAHTITATEIAALTITAAEIAANTITAAKIVAHTITASRMLIAGGGASLTDDPQVQDASAWAGSGAGFTMQTVADGKVGTSTMRATTGVHVYGAKYIPFDPLKTYRFRFWARSEGTAPGNMHGRVYHNGGGLGYVEFIGATALTTAWTEMVGVKAGSTFPAGTTLIRQGVIFNYNSATGYHEVQDVRLEEVLPSTLIQDGAITTDKIYANAVTAAKIAANTITAGQIAAHTITAAQIAANTITAGQIAATTITAAQIAANTITAGQIATNTLTANLYHELRQTMPWMGEDSCDASYPFTLDFKLPSELTAVISVKLSFKIMPFRAYSKAAAADAGQTSAGGGLLWINSTTGSTNPGDTSSVDPGDTSSVDPGNTDSAYGPGSHYHGMSSHAHTMGTHKHTMSNHTHTLDVDDHTHAIAAHGHDLTFGLYEEITAPTIHYHVDNGAGFGAASAGFTTTQTDIDITAAITGAGWKAIKFDTNLRCRIVAIVEVKVDISA